MARELGLQASECGQEEVNAWMEGTYLHARTHTHTHTHTHTNTHTHTHLHAHTHTHTHTSLPATEKRRVALPVPPPSTEGVDRDEGDVPFIPINQYRQVVEPLQQPREDGEMEGMIEQVRNVFPDLPHHVIQRDLSE